jgi:hypothetical protein
MAGLWTLLASAGIKIVVLCLGFVLWKLREKMRPPEQNEVGTIVVAAPEPRAPDRGQGYVPLSSRRDPGNEQVQIAQQALAGGNRVPWIPQQGTLLDRFLPVLVIGAVLFIVLKEARIQSLLPSAPAASASSTTTGGLTTSNSASNDARTQAANTSTSLSDTATTDAAVPDSMKPVSAAPSTARR